MENKELITSAIRYIQNNPKENLSLRNIARAAGFSLTYFDALFQKHTGYSPVEYSRVYKLTRSALKLRRTDKSILDVALEFGYQSPESFTRAFKGLYSLTPSEYREKYSEMAVTWHDLSSKITLSRFGREFPEFKPISQEAALDFLFTHDPLKYGEDIVGVTVADTAALTLDDPGDPQSFIYVSDYNDVWPTVDLVCVDERSAVRYAELLTSSGVSSFSLHLDPDADWIELDVTAAKAGLVCNRSFDMIYLEGESPALSSEDVRELTPEDLTSIRVFKERGGCAENHVRAIQISFEKKGNTGLHPVGLFKGGELAALAMPTIDAVRNFRKYDIGAIFTLDAGSNDVERIWRYVISMCRSDSAYIGNAGAKDDDSPLSVAVCESVGLTKVAEYRKYCK
ncbi:MAG: helix-turn-helix transcriptional regulator [Clostridia bacterium]|nr:helix-turn-helix transcriptional regulator [Clostridia bacterium]